MSWDRLTLVAAPAVSPLSLDAAKAHLRVDSAAEDDVIQGMIDAAVAAIDGPRGIGICLVRQTWRLTLDGFCRFIPIPLGPNVAIVSVKYDDAEGVEQTVDPGDYQLADGLDPAVLSPTFATCWPAANRATPGSVRIEFTAGFGETAEAVPADLVRALKVMVGDAYKNREGDGGLPPAALAVLDRYRAGVVA